MDLIGWVIFIVALLFSVMLHETGHFVTAKKFGMKVTRYFVGFGPTIWSTWRGETEQPETSRSSSGHYANEALQCPHRAGLH